MLPFLIAGAAIGAGMGLWSKKKERDSQEAELQRQKANAAKAYGYGKELSDSQYASQKGEALWQLGMQNRALSEGMGQFTDDYNTQLLSRAYGEQDARIQTASGIGASVAQEGMSGTRGNEANSLMRDYASDSLERQIGVQRKQDANILAGTVSNANRSITAMEHEKASWDPGGYRHDAKEANDRYNKQMFDLGQTDYQARLADMDNNKFLDYFTAAFGGASSGMSLGNTFGKTFDNFFKKKPKPMGVVPVKFTGSSVGSHGIEPYASKFELE